MTLEEGDVFTAEDLKYFDDNGYVVLHDAVPKENLQAAVDAIWNFLGMKRTEAEDWYRKPATRIGFVEIYHHQSFWNNRMHPRLHRAFTQLWGTEKLWMSFDRACMKTPLNDNHTDWAHKGFVHWDLDPWNQEIPYGLQGVLCLEDTAENQGGFHCVPTMHKWLREWVAKVPPPQSSIDKFHNGGIPINVPEKALQTLNVQKIPAKAGDLIIWRREIAHGNGVNMSQRPRLAQYICMFPERFGNEDVLHPQESLHPETHSQRIHMWKTNSPPPGKPGDTRKVEQNQQPAELTDLGKKLLGLEQW